MSFYPSPYVLRTPYSSGVAPQRNCCLPPVVSQARQQITHYFGDKGGGLHCSPTYQNEPVPIQIRINNQAIPSVSLHDDDPIPSAVYQNIHKISEFYRRMFGYPLKSSRPDGIFVANVHKGTCEANVYWDSQRQEICVGDGDSYFQRLPYSLDIMGHALTDGALDDVLPDDGQPGAVKEHLSDVVGLLAEFLDENNRTPLDEDWVIGKNVIDGHFPLRSFVEPGQAFPPRLIYQRSVVCEDLQARSYQARHHNPDFDQGGIHLNSGILNRAFYLFWKNSHLSPYRGGAPWETTGWIWFTAFAKIKNGARCESMLDFANLTLASVYDLNPQNRADPELRKVYYYLLNAWRTVGFLEGLYPFLG